MSGYACICGCVALRQPALVQQMRCGGDILSLLLQPEEFSQLFTNFIEAQKDHMTCQIHLIRIHVSVGFCLIFRMHVLTNYRLFSLEFGSKRLAIHQFVQAGKGACDHGENVGNEELKNGESVG